MTDTLRNDLADLLRSFTDETSYADDADAVLDFFAVREAGQCDGDTIPVPREVAEFLALDMEMRNLHDMAKHLRALLARTKETTTDA